MKYLSKRIRYTAAVLLAFSLAGCVSTLKEHPADYGLPTEKDQYLDLDQYSAVYALTRSTGWSSTVLAVMFDFKDDDIALNPPCPPKRKNESWVKVKDQKRLDQALRAMDGSTLKLVTLKTCFRCERVPVGAYFSPDPIRFSYNETENSMEFWKGSLEEMDAGSGGGDSGGGDSGDGGG